MVDLKYVATKHQRAGPELQPGKSCDLSTAPLCRELLPAVAEAAETCGNEGSLAYFLGSALTVMPSMMLLYLGGLVLFNGSE